MREIPLTADPTKPATPQNLITSSPTCDSQGGSCRWQPSPAPVPTASAPFQAYVAIIVIILLCAVICALALSGAIRCFLRRSSSTAAQLDSSSHETRPKKAAQSAVEVLSGAPPAVFSDGMELAGATAECAICLTEFVDGDEIRVMEECKHGFHVDCIERWLCTHSSCPTCRRNCLAALPEQHSPPTSITRESQPAAGNFLVLSTPL